LDSQCKWKMHINYLLNKMSVICFIMSRFVHILNIETLEVVYFAHFHSLIKSGVTIWGISTTIHKVFVVQKRILRTTLGIGPRSSCKGWSVKIFPWHVSYWTVIGWSVIFEMKCKWKWWTAGKCVISSVCVLCFCDYLPRSLQLSLTDDKHLDAWLPARWG
jgi:hypothetical protein